VQTRSLISVSTSGQGSRPGQQQPLHLGRWAVRGLRLRRPPSAPAFPAGASKVRCDVRDRGAGSGHQVGPPDNSWSADAAAGRGVSVGSRSGPARIPESAVVQTGDGGERFRGVGWAQLDLGGSTDTVGIFDLVSFRVVKRPSRSRTGGPTPRHVVSSGRFVPAYRGRSSSTSCRDGTVPELPTARLCGLRGRPGSALDITATLNFGTR
jgi:hypothetical protein